MEYNTKRDVWFKSITSTKYKKGHTPFTKGKKQIDWMTPEQIARFEEGKKRGWANLALGRGKGGRPKRPVIGTKGAERRKFESISAAAVFLGVDGAVIRKVCNGKGKTAGGYKWRFV